MLNRAHIINYESHEDTEVEFSPGVNVIVGLSDAGKSALFRSICWTCFNRPTGKDFMRRGTDQTSVELEFEGGPTVVRTRGKSTNTYHMDGSAYTAFGSEVPEDIGTTINLSREVNVAAQIDPLFLLQQGPADVARHFNEAAGLDDIDRSMSYLHTMERRAKGQLSSLKEREQELEEQLKEYEGLDKAEQALQEAESLHEQQEQNKGQRNRLYTTIRQIHYRQQRVDALKRATEHLPALNGLLQQRSDIGRKRDKAQQIRKTVQRYHERAAYVAELERTTHYEKDIDKCGGLQQRIKDNRALLKSWQHAVDAYKTAQDLVEHTQDWLAELEEEWHEKAPDVCPLCGGSGRLK